MYFNLKNQRTKFRIGIFCLIAIIVLISQIFSQDAFASWKNMDRTATIENLSNNSGDSQGPQIQLDSQDNPYIAWQDDSVGNGDIFFKKWTPGVGWTKMDGTAGYDNLSNNSGASKEPHLSLDSANNPYIVWSNSTGGNYEIYFSKWTPGVGWTQMDGTTLGYENISNNAGMSLYPEIRLGSNNKPYVIWQDATAGNGDIYLTHWDGTKWAKMDGTLGIDNLSNNVGGSEHWNNIQSLILDADNNPNVVWHDYTTGNGDVYFTKWTPGTGWTGMDGITLGYDNLSNNPQVGGVAQIQLDIKSNPYVVWHDDSTGNFDIYFTKWTPTVGWTQMDGVTPGYENISHNSSGSVLPNILLDSADRPYILWHDDNGSLVPFAYDVFFTKWTPGTGWTHMDGTTPGYENISNNSGSSVYFYIKLNSVNFPYIVWEDDTEGNFEIYFTRWLYDQAGQVDISAAVDPALSLTLSSTTCNLGTFSATGLSTCSYDAQVSTNGSSGYIAYIKADGTLRNATNQVADVADATVGVTNSSGVSAEEENGVSTSKASETIIENDSGENCANLAGQLITAMPASALSSSDQSFASSSGPVSADTATLCHAVVITGTTPAGVYAQTITITIVGNF